MNNRKHPVMIKLLLMVIAALVTPTLFSNANDAAAKYDLNGDTQVNIMDVTCLLNYLSTATEEAPPVYTSPTIAVKKTAVASGKTEFTVVVNVYNNPGILGMTLGVSYDDSVFTLTGATCGDALLGKLSFTKPGVYKSGCNFVWDGQELNAGDIVDGSILVLTFAIADNAPKGAYPISVSYVSGDIFDNELNPVAVDVVNSTITIS